MYYHCPFNNGTTSQSTFWACSEDGINFISENINIKHPYFRYFYYKENEYAIAMYYLKSSIILKKINNTFVEKSQILKKSRHTSVLILNEKIYIFYSTVGDCPEHIMVSEIVDLEKGIISKPTTLIFPEFEYEHSNENAIQSKYGPVYGKLNNLEIHMFTKKMITFIYFIQLAEKVVLRLH
jgi:hypothetical protein